MDSKPPLKQHVSVAHSAHQLPESLAARAEKDCCGSQYLIGAHLRQIRKEKKMSIRTLAAQCGVSANTLSLIENDRTSPSLHTLQVLARGLGIPVVALFEEEKPGHALVYQQQGMRPLVRFANGTLEKLGEGLPPLGAEPILVTLDPDQAEADDISHVGREFIYCLEGMAICVVSNQVYPLAQGDSLLFDASVPHHWSNASSAPSKLLVLFCPMEAHDLPAERHLGR